jgi:hypothetical protein
MISYFEDSYDFILLALDSIYLYAYLLFSHNGQMEEISDNLFIYSSFSSTMKIESKKLKFDLLLSLAKT